MATLMNMEYKRLNIFKNSVPDKHVRILADVEDGMVPLPDVEVNELTVDDLWTMSICLITKLKASKYLRYPFILIKFDSEI